MQPGIVGFIINAIVVKRHQHSLVDGFLQRNLIGHIVVANLVNVFAVHTFRGCRETQQEFRGEIGHNVLIALCDGMMKLINHNIIEKSGAK